MSAFNRWWSAQNNHDADSKEFARKVWQAAQAEFDQRETPMPDISMCRNRSCPSRQMCYRFTAKPSPYQWFAAFQVPEGKDRCEAYIEAVSKSQVKRPNEVTK